MKIISIEPTPSPNVMKLTMDMSLPAGESKNYTKDNLQTAPDYVKEILHIEGVIGVFQVNDFLALERHPKADWREILSRARAVFGDDSSETLPEEDGGPDSFGEIAVMVQMFKEIPMQVKLVTGSEEMRFGLPERFSQAVMKVQKVSQNLIMERKWEEQGVRYGSLKDIGEEVVQELSALYDAKRLNELVSIAYGLKDEGLTKIDGARSTENVDELLNHPDWEKRFAALGRINPGLEDIPMLTKALNDPKSSIRRLATVYLGLIGKPEVLPPLFKALKDSSAAVRRTAGDALSDIGDPLAIGAMVESLLDPNKLVRWRAARFLYEIGDASAVDALREAQDDPEFEVSLQAKIALERIESGQAASGTVWQQMTQTRAKPSKD